MKPKHNTGKDPSILIVDDTHENLKVLGNILKDNRYNVAFTDNGFQAIEIAVKLLPDLILLDVSMPEMDGFETCLKLKGLALTQEIPVIFLTARTQTEDIIHGFEAGAVDYVTKPFHSRELLTRVKTHLELKRSKEALVTNINELERTNAMLEKSHRELEQAMEEIKTLSGFLPICAQCKKIRDDKGYWNRLESYIQKHSNAKFSHSICPECSEDLYGKEDWYIKMKKEKEERNQQF